MKHILSTLAVVCLLATTAYAGTIVSYNPSWGKPIKVLSRWMNGFDKQAVIYSYNAQGCLVVTVVQYAFGIETGRRVTEFPCR